MTLAETIIDFVPTYLQEGRTTLSGASKFYEIALEYLHSPDLPRTFKSLALYQLPNFSVKL